METNFGTRGRKVWGNVWSNRGRVTYGVIYERVLLVVKMHKVIVDVFGMTTLLNKSHKYVFNALVPSVSINQVSRKKSGVMVPSIFREPRSGSVGSETRHIS